MLERTSTLEINLLRPLSLPAVERNLLEMVGIVGHKKGLPAEYQPLLDKVQDAWEYYRPSQPAQHKLHIDNLIAALYGAGGTLK